MDKLTIVKVGGKIVEDEQSLNQLINDFKSISGPKILVHGGGRSATALAARLGIETQMVEGRRITDQPMLEVAVMVYAGLVNKTIVAGLQAKGCNAAGFTGADLDLIRAMKRPVKEIDYGFVGDVIDINTSELRLLIAEGVAPVIAPITHNGKGQLLNTNADTIATEMAIDLAKFYAVTLVFCFEKDGVLSKPDDEKSVIHDLDKSMYMLYKAEGVISEGMIPKLDNAFRAINSGVYRILITNARNLTKPAAVGTSIIK
jgi:acetylglutamate kinase